MGRLLNFALAEDFALNSLGGGKPNETISGTIGRAYRDGAAWAKAARWIVDGLFGQRHCVRMAEKEDRQRVALSQIS